VPVFSFPATPRKSYGVSGVGGVTAQRTAQPSMESVTGVGTENSIQSIHFCRAMLCMHKRGLRRHAVSVCPPVCHVYVYSVKTNKDIFNFLTIG